VGYPVVPFQLFMVPDGMLIENAAVTGTEPPGAVGRRVMDLKDVQAIRVQFAHNLADTLVRVRLEYLATSGWLPLIPDSGDLVAAWEPQASLWYAPPKFLPDRVTVRALILGDGAIDPRILFITVETK